MKQFVQNSGEAKYYQQVVANDTITSATWTVSPNGPVLSRLQSTTTSSTIMISTPQTGVFVLSVNLTLGSGQVLIGECMIQVI